VQVTNGLLERAMTESGKDRFLIDGFPRNEENRAAFEADTGEVSSTARCQTALPAVGTRQQCL
jgi:adenylate kinase family enzyme